MLYNVVAIQIAIIRSVKVMVPNLLSQFDTHVRFSMIWLIKRQQLPAPGAPFVYFCLPHSTL